MKTRRKVFAIVAIVLATIIVVALVVPGIVFPSKWSIQQKTIEGRTVFQLQRTGEQYYPKLAANNSHKLLIQQWGNSWLDEAAHDYLFDLSDFDRFAADPSACSTLISTYTTGGNFSSGGDKIVWAEHPSGGDVLQSVRGFDLKTMKPFDIDTRDSLFFKSAPTASGNFVVYQGTDGNGDNQVQLFDISNKQWRQLTLDNTINRHFPIIIGSKIVWADRRNDAKKGYGLYGFDLAKNSEFLVKADKTNSRRFEFNGRYVLFGGYDRGKEDYYNIATMSGLYLFDTQTSKKIEIAPKSSVITGSFQMTVGDDPLIAWVEQIENKNGTFLAVKYKRLSETDSHFISNSSTLNGYQGLLSITDTHICYDVSGASDCLGNPYVFRIADKQSFKLDDRNCGNIVADDELVGWSVYDDGSSRVCVTRLP